MATYELRTTCWNDRFAVRADWAQAASPVFEWGDGEWVPDPQGRQVADFRHRPELALRSCLARYAADADDAESANREVDEAMARAAIVADAETEV
jgi:hypothetical protein